MIEVNGSEIVLYGTVGDSLWDYDFFTAREVRQALAGMSGEVTVRLNSGGGIATEGQAIYRALADHDGRVRVVIDGAAASAASLIAMAGDEIAMPAGSWMLIHDPAMMWTDGRGTEADHEKAARMLGVIGDTYAMVYAQRAGMSVAEAREIMRAETVYGPEDAVAAGFATEAGEGTAEAAAPFPYQIYANAPKELARGSGAGLTREAVATAMFAGLSRVSAKEAGMPGSRETAVEVPAAVAAEAAETNVAEASAAAPEVAVAPKMDAKAITMAERTRIRRIRDTVRAAGLKPEMADDLIDRGVGIEAAIDAIVTAQANEQDPDREIAPPRPTMQVMRDGSERFAEGATKSILARAGMEGGERNEFSGMSLLELARASMNAAGVPVRGRTKLDVAGEAFGVRMTASHSTSDFPAILENIANKAMLRGFEEQEETFQTWTSRGSMPDFKQGKRVGIDAFPSLSAVAEGAEFSYGTVGDFGEPVILGTYGKLFKITRQAIVNDDLDAFTRIPQRMGRAARRTVGDLAYGVLTGNPAMSDTVALFHADHGNLAGSAGAPAVASIEAGMAAMAVQTDRSENATALNIRAAYILAPFAHRGVVKQVLESEYDPAKSTRSANTVRHAVTPVFDARLDADSATAWYLAASPMSGDTIEISYLDGNDQPFLDSRDGWSVDGIEFKVRIDAAATPLAWEGLYKNAGG